MPERPISLVFQCSKDWARYDALVDSLSKGELREALKREARLRREYQERLRDAVHDAHGSLLRGLESSVDEMHRKLTDA